MTSQISEKLANWKVRKAQGLQLAALTAADYPTGRLLDEAGVDFVLVGDSLGMVVLGYTDTTEVTLDEMVHHTKAVRRGVANAVLGADLPFHTYDTPAEALRNAKKLVAAGADAVKLEGGCEMLPQIQAILAAGIPVVGHIGMLPQSVREEGGYKKKGKTDSEAERLLADAVALDAAGVSAIVLEGMVASVADKITSSISVPTIGIGSGLKCDGQILVTHDLTGAFPWFRPPFAKARGDVAGVISQAVRDWKQSLTDAAAL